jgi:hypothetical protein
MITSHRFEELLPFYVNGTLAQADREWVDGYLREHPQAAAELEGVRTLQSRIRADVPAVSSEVGIERALQRIRRDGPAPQRPRRAAQPSLAQRLGAWLSTLVPQPVLKPAFVVALAVVAVQGVVIVQMAGEREDDASLIRAMPPTTQADQASYLKVNFKGDARESDIRMLLVEIQGSLAAGPGQLGDYYVRVPATQVEAQAARLRGSSIVEAVAVVDALPPGTPQGWSMR